MVFYISSALLMVYCVIKVVNSDEVVKESEDFCVHRDWDLNKKNFLFSLTVNNVVIQIDFKCETLSICDDLKNTSDPAEMIIAALYKGFSSDDLLNIRYNNYVNYEYVIFSERITTEISEFFKLNNTGRLVWTNSVASNDLNQNFISAQIPELIYTNFVDVFLERDSLKETISKEIFDVCQGSGCSMTYSRKVSSWDQTNYVVFFVINYSSILLILLNLKLCGDNNYKEINENIGFISLE